MIKVPVEMLNETVSRMSKVESTLTQSMTVLNKALGDLQLESASRRTIDTKINQAKNLTSRLAAESNRLSSYLSTCSSRFVEADRNGSSSIQKIYSAFKLFSQPSGNHSGLFNSSIFKPALAVAGLGSLTIAGLFSGVSLPWVRERIDPTSTAPLSKSVKKNDYRQPDKDISNTENLSNSYDTEQACAFSKIFTSEQLSEKELFDYIYVNATIRPWEDALGPNPTRGQILEFLNTEPYIKPADLGFELESYHASYPVMLHLPDPPRYHPKPISTEGVRKVSEDIAKIGLGILMPKTIFFVVLDRLKDLLEHSRLSTLKLYYI